MAFKVLLLVVQGLFFQTITGAYYNGGSNRFSSPRNSPCGAAPYSARPYSNKPAALLVSKGGGLFIRSYSSIAPLGVSVVSENTIEGILSVTGELPFLGSVALEGALPTAGAGDVAYGSSNRNVAMLAEDIAPNFNVPYGYGCERMY